MTPHSCPLLFNYENEGAKLFSMSNTGLTLLSISSSEHLSGTQDCWVKASQHKELCRASSIWPSSRDHVCWHEPPECRVGMALSILSDLWMDVPPGRTFLLTPLFPPIWQVLGLQGSRKRTDTSEHWLAEVTQNRVSVNPKRPGVSVQIYNTAQPRAFRMHFQDNNSEAKLHDCFDSNEQV